MQTQMDSSDQALALNAAYRILDEAWDELKRRPFVQQKLGISPTRLPDVSPAEAERRSAVGRSLLRQLDALDVKAIPHSLVLALRLVRFRAETWVRESEWYWSVIDPRGVGIFGLFLPTAYCGGFVLNFIHQQLKAFRFQSAGDADRYLGWVADYAELIEQFAARTTGQAERGMRMPHVQVLQARTLLTALKAGARSALSVAPGRISSIDASHFARELEARIASQVEPAFDRALQSLSEDYLARAPQSVGMSQYPGGADIYAELVKLHTTSDLTPQRVHDEGLARIGDIEASMDAIRREIGFEGDAAAFLDQLRRDPRWRARTIQEISVVFQRYIDRLKPRLPEVFSSLPEASYGVTSLPEALRGSMTYGYYDGPRNDRKEGVYLFNPSNLLEQPLFNVAALTYHELMPGHHLHFAAQYENARLHPFCAYSFVTAYVEGWAEYAATLAGELGLYQEPEERYGRLVMDAFLTCRLVVDTGMNALGWSLEKAREYLRAHSGMPEAEILTESVRYSSDIPAQALAYKLGDTRIMALRQRMRSALGERFRIKDFHAAVLSPGAVPIPDLEWHVERVMIG